MRAASAALHYLQIALDAAATIENYTVPGDLLECVAREYAKAGDHSKAYELALQASQAREKIHTTDAGSRAVAMQITHETEKARAEGEHQRQLAVAHAQRADTLEVANATLEQLGAVGRDITKNLSADSIFAALDTHVHALLDATTFWVYRLQPDSQALTMVFGVEAGQRVSSHSIRLDDAQSNAASCARERQEIIANIAPGLGNNVPGTLDTLSLMYAPLLTGGRLLGVMTIQSCKLHAYAEREVAIFQTLSAYAAIALVNAETQELLLQHNIRLEKLSTSDTLTGLYNRLRLDQVLKDEACVSERTHAPVSVSVILLDVDNFKAVNDGHGHKVGDQVLVAIAKILKEQSREVDVVGRWGGEEFLIVCRNTPLEGACVLAEKLRTAIATFVFPVVDNKTASLGVATMDDTRDIDALIGRADTALYRAKKLGRNRVEVGI